MRRRATALSWRDAGQSGVAAVSVVVNFVAIKLAFEIGLVPKKSLIDVFAQMVPIERSMKACDLGVQGIVLISSISRIRYAVAQNSSENLTRQTGPRGRRKRRTEKALVTCGRLPDCARGNPMSIEEAVMTDVFGKPETWENPYPAYRQFRDRSPLWGSGRSSFSMEIRRTCRSGCCSSTPRSVRRCATR
jgi:hypothetical protein